MLPFYFRHPDSIFGLYHPAQGDKLKDAGIVLCYPIGQEYIRIHRVFSQLANTLSLAGFPVLRFDYFGTGDSAGEFEHATPAQWITDINSAVEELRNRSSCRKVHLVGYRLGASFATLHALQQGDISRLVLLKPVINGTEYWKEILQAHQNWIKGAYAVEKDTGNCVPVAGFPFSPAMQEGIAQIGLLDMQKVPSDAILAIEEENPPSSFQQFCDLQKQFDSSQMAVVRIANDAMWLKQIRAIRKWLVEASA